MANQFPQFDFPPLDEVVIGVQFEPLTGFHAAHLGRFWSRVRERYPYTEDQSPIAPVIELPAMAPTVTPAFSVEPMPIIPRCWLLDESRNQLVQVQSDRFLRNWRQLDGSEPYPHYSALIGAFRRDWSEFLAFLHDEGISQPSVNQCELTYINKFPALTESGLLSLNNVFSPIQLKSEGAGFLPAPEYFSWTARYPLPEGRGRLRVRMQPAFAHPAMKLVHVLDLTARGAAAEPAEQAIFAWFDLAHEWVVRGFEELTDPAMHKLWGKQP